jgi:hypothetical protein
MSSQTLAEAWEPCARDCIDMSEIEPLMPAVGQKLTGHRCIVNLKQAARAVQMGSNPFNSHPEFQQGMIQVPATGRTASVGLL